RLLPGAGGLGGGDRAGEPGRRGAVLRHLLLDPAALLGAGDEVPRRLRGGGRADAPGGRARRCGGAEDRVLLLRDGRGHAGPGPVRRLAVRVLRGRSRRLVPGRGAPAAGAGRRRRRPGPHAAVPPVDRVSDIAVHGGRRDRAAALRPLGARDHPGRSWQGSPLPPRRPLGTPLPPRPFPAPPSTPPPAPPPAPAPRS